MFTTFTDGDGDSPPGSSATFRFTSDKALDLPGTAHKILVARILPAGKRYEAIGRTK